MPNDVIMHPNSHDNTDSSDILHPIFSKTDVKPIRIDSNRGIPSSVSHMHHRISFYTPTTCLKPSCFEMGCKEGAGGSFAYS